MSSLDQASRIGFIGAGVVGKSLALALFRRGYNVHAAASRTFASAQALTELAPGCVAYPVASDVAENSDVVFITTPDDAIVNVATDITWRKGQAVVHCSGVTSLDALEPARSLGVKPGALHPLQVFPSVEEAVKSLPGSTFAIEGDEEMRAYLKEMVLALGGNPIFLRSEDKLLYHATAVLMGGILNGVAGAVAAQWKHFGIERNQALKSLAPLMIGTAKSLSEIGLPDSAVGPHIRGDVGTVRKHLDVFKKIAPEMLPLYCQMALAALPTALEKGIASEESVAEIREILIKASIDR